MHISVYWHIPKNKYHINFVRVTIYNSKKSMIQILQDIELR